MKNKHNALAQIADEIWGRVKIIASAGLFSETEHLPVKRDRIINAVLEPYNLCTEDRTALMIYLVTAGRQLFEETLAPRLKELCIQRYS